jgi:hypothetical protein
MAYHTKNVHVVLRLAQLHLSVIFSSGCLLSLCKISHWEGDCYACPGYPRGYMLKSCPAFTLWSSSPQFLARQLR